MERFDPPGAGERAELTIAAQVKNLNPFGITLKRIAYEVILEDKSIGRGELAPDVFIASDAQAPLRFRLAASLSGDRELIRAVAGAFTDTPLPFEIRGIVVFDSRSHEFSTRNSTLLRGETMAREVLVPPRLRLLENESSVFMLRPDVPVIRAVLSAVNTGGIGYFLYGRDAQAYLGGHLIAVQDIAPVPVPAGQESRFELLFYPQLTGDEEVRTFGAALEGIPTLLELRGDVLLDVLGVDSFAVENGLSLSGFVFTNTP